MFNNKSSRREIEKRDQEDGTDVQKQYVRPGSSVSGSGGRPASGRPSSGRPSSGRPSSGRPSSGRPSSRSSVPSRPDSAASDRNGPAQRPMSAKRDRTPPTRVSEDNNKNVMENSAVQTDLDLVDYGNVVRFQN